MFRNRRKLKIVGMGLAVVLLLAVLHQFILEELGAFLIDEEPLEQADLIVVLAGAEVTRPYEAALLHRNGWAPNVLVSREPATNERVLLLAMRIPVPDSVELSIEVLTRLGVPRENIWTVERPAYSTYSEAQHVRDYLKTRGVRRAIIVTANYHTRRSCGAFEHFLGPLGIEVICRSTRFDTFHPRSWWRQRLSRKRVLDEYQKMAYYQLYYIRDLLRGVP